MTKKEQKVLTKPRSRQIGKLFRVSIIPDKYGYAEVKITKFIKRQSVHKTRLIGVFQNNRLNAKAMAIYNQYRSVKDCNQTWDNFKRGDKL